MTCQIFVVGHIIAAVFWVVGTYYHVFLLESLETVKWVYAAIAIWGFDRFVRGARLAWINSPRLSSLVRKAGSKRRTLFEAHAQVISAGEFVRIRVTPTRGWPAAAAGPGTYVFVSRPWHWASWGNHPLTIAWPAGMPPVPSALDEQDSQEPIEAADLDAQLARPGDKTSFELVMKRWDAFTKRLTKGMRPSGDNETGDVLGGIGRVSLCVEGPCTSLPRGSGSRLTRGRRRRPRRVVRSPRRRAPHRRRFRHHRHACPSRGSRQGRGREATVGSRDQATMGHPRLP